MSIDFLVKLFEHNNWANLKIGDQKPFNPQLQTKDGFHTIPWVVMLQVVNHATEHREQIKSMLSALDVTPPDIDGWDYAEANNALIPISK